MNWGRAIRQTGANAQKWEYEERRFKIVQRIWWKEWNKKEVEMLTLISKCKGGSGLNKAVLWGHELAQGLLSIVGKWSERSLEKHFSYSGLIRSDGDEVKSKQLET